jgi:hypothetical protein
MSASEFGRWRAFFEQEPVGPGVSMAQWAELMAALHNGPLRKASKALWTAADFTRAPWAPPPAAPKPATGADARRYLEQLKRKRGA